jgi:hypothetical protein
VQLYLERVIIMAKNSQKTKPLSVKIAEPQQKLAFKAIDAMISAYEPIAARLLKIAEPMYKLAVLAAQLGKSVPEYTQAYFKELCKHSEAHAKEAHAVDNLKDLLPCWSVFKSEINRAIEGGLDPKDFNSYSALKAARVELDRKTEAEALERQQRESAAMRTGARSGTEPGTGEGDAGTGEIPDARVPSTKLKAILLILPKAVGGMDEETQDAFAEELATLIAKYTPKDVRKAPRQRKAKETAEQTAEQNGESVAA